MIQNMKNSISEDDCKLVMYYSTAKETNEYKYVIQWEQVYLATFTQRT